MYYKHNNKIAAALKYIENYKGDKYSLYIACRKYYNKIYFKNKYKNETKN